MRQKMYTTPEMEIIKFSTEDVITGSQPQIDIWDSYDEIQQTNLDADPWPDKEEN